MHNGEAIALKILETGKARLDQVNKCGNTALMGACHNKMEEVALRIIESGSGRPEQADIDGDTALTISERTGLDRVTEALRRLPAAPAAAGH